MPYDSCNKCRKVARVRQKREEAMSAKIFWSIAALMLACSTESAADGDQSRLGQSRQRTLPYLIRADGFQAAVISAVSVG
jgi:hypothetical protein